MWIDLTMQLALPCATNMQCKNTGCSPLCHWGPQTPYYYMPDFATQHQVLSGVAEP